MSILKNYSYNLLYQITLIIIPIITIPYITRVIGSNGIGTYSFIGSITQYFLLFANMGLSIYASREIAYVKQDIYKTSKLFTEIVFIQLISSSIMFIAYCIYIYLFSKEYFSLYLIQSLLIISIAFDISWFYIGIEDFKKNVIRNLIVRIISLALLFVLVKTPDDLWKYMLLLASSTIFGQIYMWIGVSKYIRKIKFNELRIIQHIHKVKFFFLIYLIGIIGSNLSKTLIGIYVNNDELGKFEMVYRIIMTLLVILTSLGSVMSPRISSTFAEGNHNKINEYLKSSLQFTLMFCFLVIPLLIGISKNFISWFFGITFEGAGWYLVLLSPMILLNSLSNFITNQYMIPTGNERKYVISLVIGGTIGVISSFILIARFSTQGACIAILISELTVLLSHIFQIRKQFNFHVHFVNIWQYIIAAILVLLISFLISKIAIMPIIMTFIQITISSLAYLMILYLLGNRFLINITERVKSKIW